MSRRYQQQTAKKCDLGARHRFEHTKVLAKSD